MVGWAALDASAPVVISMACRLHLVSRLFRKATKRRSSSRCVGGITVGNAVASGMRDRATTSSLHRIRNGVL
jgi:hypothetical protein